jgi:hypothetical protein
VRSAAGTVAVYAKEERMSEHAKEIVATNWKALVETGEAARLRDAPLATIRCAEQEALFGASDAVDGPRQQVWSFEGGLIRVDAPGFLERLLAGLFGIVALVLSPLFALRDALDRMLLRLAGALGAVFPIVGIPLAFLAFFGDMLALIAEFIGSLAGLIFHPLRLVKAFLAFPFRLAARLLARLLRTFVLGLVARLVDAVSRPASALAELLSRQPWLRGVLQGYLRQDRPTHPAVVPAEAVSQVLRVTRRSIFGARRYLLVVEGAPIEPGWAPRWAHRLKRFALPWYWERTVHVFRIDGTAGDQAAAAISSALKVPVLDWDGRSKPPVPVREPLPPRQPETALPA